MYLVPNTFHVEQTYLLFYCGTSLSLKEFMKVKSPITTIQLICFYGCPVDLAVPFIRLKNLFSPVPNQIRDAGNGQTYMFKCINPLPTIRNS